MDWLDAEAELLLFWAAELLLRLCLLERSLQGAEWVESEFAEVDAGLGVSLGFEVPFSLPDSSLINQ
jgi:hypothetical protein